MCTDLLGPDEDMPRMQMREHCNAARSANFRPSFSGGLCAHEGVEALAPGCDLVNDAGERFRLWVTNSSFACSGVTGTGGATGGSMVTAAAAAFVVVPRIASATPAAVQSNDRM